MSPPLGDEINITIWYECRLTVFWISLAMHSQLGFFPPGGLNLGCFFTNSWQGFQLSSSWYGGGKFLETPFNSHKGGVLVRGFQHVKPWPSVPHTSFRGGNLGILPSFADNLNQQSLHLSGYIKWSYIWIPYCPDRNPDGDSWGKVTLLALWFLLTQKNATTNGA